MRLLLLVMLLVSTALVGRSAVAQDLYGLPAQWTDERMQRFELKDLQGSWTVLTMAYGACRRICATSLRTLEQVQALADAQGTALNFIVVGLDPAQDKPADWAALRQERRLTRANWRFLSGSADSTRVLAQRLGVRYWRYGEHTMHDYRVVLIAPDGQVARRLDRFDEPASRLLP
jgi:cytochrome oxidase Cu insertion factor (SCO1/SenC/PrrC family)